MIYKNNFKFGVTNFGDACEDQRWSDVMHSVIGAVISSKKISKDFADKLLKHQDKIIYHAGITGFGGTLLEPGIPATNKVFEQIEYITYRGFSPKQIVIDIEPIFPYCWFDKINNILNIDYINELKNILLLAEKYEIQRIRHSFLKFNSLTMKKLYNFNNDLTIDSDWKFDISNELALSVLNNNFIFESNDLFYPYTNHIPIISNEDLEILGLSNEYRFNDLRDSFKNQLELIPHQCSCSGGCIYCDLGNFKSFDLFDKP